MPVLKKALRQLLPRTLKPHRILGGPLQNAMIVTSWHDYPAAILGKTERPLLDWFARNVRAGETWLDIGAHYGYTAIALSRLVGTNGRVYAFEPMVASAGCISQTRRLNHLTHLTVLPLALGDPVSLAFVNLPVERGMVDSTLTPHGTAAVWHESFLLGSLDGLWDILCTGDARVHGVKIDVQGMELAALRGMCRLLKTQHPKLAIEVHRGVSREELVALLAEYGYLSTAQPIEPAPGETTAQFLDDKSYAFTV